MPNNSKIAFFKNKKKNNYKNKNLTKNDNIVENNTTGNNTTENNTVENNTTEESDSFLKLKENEKLKNPEKGQVYVHLDNITNVIQFFQFTGSKWEEIV